MAFDLIVVPGGGLRPDGTLPPWVAARFDRALALRDRQPVLSMSAGTTHKPNPVDARGFPISEAGAGARYLIERGVPPSRILMEAASYDTIGNAWFARRLHIEPQGWTRLLVITSEFHIDRAEAIFRWVLSVAPDTGCRLSFEAVPEAGMPAADLAFRRRREAERLHRVRELAASITTVAGLHQFLFTQHDAYSAEGLLKDREQSPELDRVY